MRQKNLIFAFGTVLCSSLFGLAAGIEKQWTSLPYGGFEFSYKSKLPYGVFRFNFTASLNEEGNQDINAIISCSGQGDQWEANDPDVEEEYRDIKYVMCNPGDFITFRFFNDSNYFSHFVENTASKRNLGRDYDAITEVNIWLRLEELEPVEIGYGEGIPSAGFFRLVNNTHTDLQGFSYSNERTEFLSDPFNFIAANRDFQFKPTGFRFFAYMTPFTMPRNATFPTDFYLLQDNDNAIASWKPSRVKFLENGEVYPFVSYGPSYNPEIVCARVPTDKPYFLQFGEDFTPFVETELYSYYFNDSTICTINDETEFDGDDIQFFLTRGETLNLGEEKSVNCSTGSVVPFTIRKKTSNEVVVATIRSSNGASTAVGKRKFVVQDISKNDFHGSRFCTNNDVDVQTAVQLSVITVDIDSESTKMIEFEEGQELAVVKITTQSAAAFEWTSAINPPFRFDSDGKLVPVNCVAEYDCGIEDSAAFFFTASNPLYVQVFNPNVEVNNQTGTTTFLEGSFEFAFQLSGKPFQQNHLVFNSNTTSTQDYNEDEYYLFTVTIPANAKCIYIYQNLDDAVLDFLPTSVNSDHSEDFYSLPSSDVICKKGNRDTVTWLSTIQPADGDLTFQAPIFLGFEEDNLSYGETYTFNDNKTRVLILPPNDSDLVQFEFHNANAVMFGGASATNFEDEVVMLPKNQQPILIKFGAANWMDQVTNMSFSTHPFSILKYQYCDTNNDCGGYPCRNQICVFPSTLTSTSSMSTSSSSTTTSPAVSTALNEGDVAMSLKITFNGKLSNFNSTRFEERIASVLDLSSSRVHVTNVSLASSSKRQSLSILKVSFTILKDKNSTISAQSAAQNLFELVQNNDSKLFNAGIDVNGPLEIVTPFSFTDTATSISQTKNAAVVSFASKLGLSWIFVVIQLFYL